MFVNGNLDARGRVLHPWWELGALRRFDADGYVVQPGLPCRQGPLETAEAVSYRLQIGQARRDSVANEDRVVPASRRVFACERQPNRAIFANVDIGPEVAVLGGLHGWRA